MKTSKLTRPLLIGCAALLLVINADAATITYTPTTLAEFQAVGVLVQSSGTNTGGGTAPTTATSTITDPTVETPNQLRITTSVSPSGFAAYRHDIVGATFNPSTAGVLNSVDFAIDVNDPAVTGTDDTPIYFGLTQGGNNYVYTENTGTAAGIFQFRNSGGSSVNPTPFLAFDKNGLTATQFALFPGTAGASVASANQTSNPDFSASGGAIQFGIYGFSGSSGESTRISDFRNTELILNFTPVPEPATIVMLLGGAGLLLFRRRR